MTWSAFAREIGLDAVYDVQPPPRTSSQNPTAATIPMNASFMKLFGLPLEVEEVILCKVCSKPILQSAYATHIDNCAAATAAGHQNAQAQEHLSLANQASQAPVWKQEPGTVADTWDDPEAPNGTVPAPAAGGNSKKKKQPQPAVKKQPKGPIDFDKQCGVMSGGEPCARSLACKVHSKADKRAVVGRSDTFQNLLERAQAENRKGKPDLNTREPSARRAALMDSPLSARPTDSMLVLQPALPYPPLQRKISTYKSRVALARCLMAGI
ncbi:SCA7, zinc-binding domain-containing protein [Hyaloraphidium curvatum]|nr:SCA7, zinc-binding domain-containing protein [Hyaloraphidium curvatum]